MAKQALNVPDRAYKPNPKYKIGVLEEFPDLLKWLGSISRFSKVEDFIYISDYKKGAVRLKIFTKDHQYNITAHLPKPNEFMPGLKNPKTFSDDGYLGCISDTRKPRAGEDWNRGNDLADGGYNEETWQKIKDDILAYELVKAVRNSPDKEPESKAIEAVIKKETELLEMFNGHLGRLKQNDELGFMWNRKHFVIRKGDFSN